MNRNEKEKTARIEIRTKPHIKKRIQEYAGKCGLSVSEYILNRALGYKPKTAVPDEFYDFYAQLCDIANRELSEKTEAELLNLIDRIHNEILLPEKEADKWRPQDYGPSKEV